MIYTDYTKIKKVTFKVPELMSENAEAEAIKLFNDIRELKDKISDLRMEASNLEKNLKVLEAKWNILSSLLDIEFETGEKEDIQQTVNIGFNFGTEVNKHIH